VIARFGGEEFVVVLPAASPSHVLEVAERLRARISRDPVRFGGRDIVMTASIGAFAVPHDFALNPDDALHQADDALYAAKNAGRNRVHAATVPA
jgi:diguanylate cyclase (GGDEF)-like protein